MQLRRADRLRSLAELDPRTGDAPRVLPQTKLTDYQLSRDGSFVTFREDATEKTDYDVISGTTEPPEGRVARRRRQDADRRQDAEDDEPAMVR